MGSLAQQISAIFLRVLYLEMNLFSNFNLVDAFVRTTAVQQNSYATQKFASHRLLPTCNGGRVG